MNTDKKGNRFIELTYLCAQQWVTSNDNNGDRDERIKDFYLNGPASTLRIISKSTSTPLSNIALQSCAVRTGSPLARVDQGCKPFVQ